MVANHRIRGLIMESIPNEAGRTTTYSALFSDVASYCSELQLSINSDLFWTELSRLHQEQCLVYFNENNIKPTQYGLNKYNQ